MRTLKTIGVVATALLLTAGVALAKEQSSEDKSGDSRLTASSTSERIKSVREEAKSRMESKREKAEKRLADIQDKVKKEMAQRLADQFENLNSTWTDRFIDQLDRYDAFLVKVQSRADVASTSGKDVSGVTDAIESAKTAIETARAKVIAQAANPYALDASIIPTIATSTPSGQEKIMKALRASFQTLHKSLFKDLFALRDGPMKDAHKAMQNALQSLGKSSGSGDSNATSTDKKSND